MLDNLKNKNKKLHRLVRHEEYIILKYLANMQQVVHYFLHLVFPFIIAFIFFRKNFLKVYFIFLLTMLVDLDHLVAVPLFDPCRCSIGFHPLHSYYAIGVYIIAFFIPRTRVIALGLLMHMATDAIDCKWMLLNC